MIRWFFNYLLLLSLSIWVGSVVFFSAVVAPGIFTSLERGAAGSLLARIFPSYYLTGTLCGLAALMAAALLFLFESGARVLRAVQVALILLMLFGNVYAGTILEGRVRQARQERAGALSPPERSILERRFQKLHGRSVALNLAVLGLGVVGIGTLAGRKR